MQANSTVVSNKATKCQSQPSEILSQPSDSRNTWVKANSKISNSINQSSQQPAVTIKGNWQLIASGGIDFFLSPDPICNYIISFSTNVTYLHAKLGGGGGGVKGVGKMCRVLFASQSKSDTGIGFCKVSELLTNQIVYYIDGLQAINI